MAARELRLFREKLKSLFGWDYLSVATADNVQLASSTDFINKARTHAFSGDLGSITVSADINGLFIKNFNNNITYAEGFHRHSVAKRLRCERVVAMEVYMLCPQHGLLFQGPDVERFVNWVSELQVDAQGTKRMEYKHCPSHAEKGFEAIASAKRKGKFIQR